MGAMPGDVVLVRTFEGSGEKREAEVVEITEENFSRFTGEIITEFGQFRLVPDTLAKCTMAFDNPLGLELREHDKVMAVVTERGKRHSEHRCEITAAFGSSLRAAVCALSVLELNGITPCSLMRSSPRQGESPTTGALPTRSLTVSTCGTSPYSPSTVRIPKIWMTLCPSIVSITAITCWASTSQMSATMSPPDLLSIVRPCAAETAFIC